MTTTTNTDAKKMKKAKKAKKGKTEKKIESTTPAALRPRALSYSRTTATAARVLRQLGHDPRTIALLILIPCVMLFLLRYVFDGNPRVFDSIGASLLGIFPLITMFLVTSIATLRERTSGTLERLLSMPLGKGDLIMRLRPGLRHPGDHPVRPRHGSGRLVPRPGRHRLPWLLLVVALLDALLGTALGLFVSAFASSEYQAVQFMLTVIFPQLLLCGLFTPAPTCTPPWKPSRTSSPCPTPSTA